MTREKLSSGDIIDRLAEKAGITKKLAAELLRAIPEVVEEGLQADGEAKVRGLGTFRLKTVAPKKGRNPKTGEEVIIPSHDKIVFQPEESFKDQANEDFKWLGIKVLEEEPVGSRQSATSPPSPPDPLFPLSKLERGPGGEVLEEVGGQQSAVGSPEPGTLEPGTLEPVYWNPEPEAVGSHESGVGSPEPGPMTKKQNNWIIPVIVLVIIALSVVFYFRNCSTVLPPLTEQATEKPVAPATALNSGAFSSLEPGTRNPEPGTLEPEAVGSQQSGVSNLEPGTPDPGTPDPGTLEQYKQNPPLNPQHSTLNTSLPTTKTKTHLYQLAREAYSNPFLWVLIYRANLDKISNPDQVVNGSELTIPALEGSPKKLTHSDSSNVSDGFRLVYEYYLQHGDSRAEEFRLVMLKYKPE